jgi:hypothetical protein
MIRFLERLLINHARQHPAPQPQQLLNNRQTLRSAKMPHLRPEPQHISTLRKDLQMSSPFPRVERNQDEKRRFTNRRREPPHRGRPCSYRPGGFRLPMPGLPAKSYCISSRRLLCSWPAWRLAPFVFTNRSGTGKIGKFPKGWRSTREKVEIAEKPFFRSAPDDAPNGCNWPLPGGTRSLEEVTSS